MKEYYNEDFRKHGGAYSSGFYASRNRHIALKIKELKLFPKVCFEIACAEGNLAYNILKEHKQITKYYLSYYADEALKLASKNLAEFANKTILFNLDAENYDEIAKYKFDTFICTCLEHIRNDRQIIKSLPLGTIIIISLPNFSWPGHLRTFRSLENCFERYEDLIHFIWWDVQDLQKYSSSIFGIFYKIRSWLYRNRYNKIINRICNLFGLDIVGSKLKYNLIGIRL